MIVKIVSIIIQNLVFLLILYFFFVFFWGGSFSFCGLMTFFCIMLMLTFVFLWIVRMFFYLWLICFSSILTPLMSQFSSVTQSCLTLCDPKNCSMPGSLSIINPWSLLKLMSVELVMPSTISSSVVPFSSGLQSSPASGSFQMNQFVQNSCQDRLYSGS